MPSPSDYSIPSSASIIGSSYKPDTKAYSRETDKIVQSISSINNQNNKPSKNYTGSSISPSANANNFDNYYEETNNSRSSESKNEPELENIASNEYDYSEVIGGTFYDLDRPL